MLAFYIQQQFFRLDSSCEACQGMVGADDSMARDEDTHAVGSDGLRHSPYALEVVHSQGNLLVGSCLAVWDFKQGFPYLLLEIGAYWVQQNIERLALACEIFVKFRLGLFQDGRGSRYELGIQKSFQTMLVALRTWLFVPIAEAKLIAY